MCVIVGYGSFHCHYIVTTQTDVELWLTDARIVDYAVANELNVDTRRITMPLVIEAVAIAIFLVMGLTILSIGARSKRIVSWALAAVGIGLLITLLFVSDFGFRLGYIVFGVVAGTLIGVGALYIAKRGKQRERNL